MAEYSKDEIKKIEKKWQEKWERDGIYRVSDRSDKPKYYVLDMFPYPSGAGLHVGHPLGYIASDIVSRYKRIKGYNVLHPMGFDAFGLPAEQYAIQTGQHPEKTTRVNIETYKRQLKQIGFSYDWSREVQTCDPAYYKWTQWIFMQLFNAWYNKAAGSEGRTEAIATLIAELEKSGNKNVVAACSEDAPVITAEQWKGYNEKEKENFLQHYRIAYQSETMVNWCAALGTVLSNDEVKDGVSERGGYPVERKKMLQWSMRITAYAERLLQGLDVIDWPEPVKEMQRNWIGKSLGCELSFKIQNSKFNIDVFTTRIDTIFGVTFLVLAPEHELVNKITTDAQRAEVNAYVDIAKNRSERERMSEVKRVSGAFTGAYAEHPFSKEQLPIWIADYVLAGYGTGAVMAVPGHDERDHRFAKQYQLPIVQVVEGPSVEEEAFVSWEAKIINSDFLNGLVVDDAIALGIKKVEELSLGKGKVNFRMRDAIFGRQRYWGEPFPVYYKDGLPHLVDLKHLPVTLPEIDEYKPTETGEPPLGRAKDWKYTATDSGQRIVDSGPRTVDNQPTTNNEYPYELTTMPGWAGSSWYWFRYMDPKNEGAFCAKDIQAYWKDVDLYMGGSEHATGHLLYSRFWCKALKDLGYVDAEEPFKKLINQGHIQGVTKFVYRATFSIGINTKDGWRGELKPLLLVSKRYSDKFQNNTLLKNDRDKICEKALEQFKSQQWNRPHDPKELMEKMNEYIVKDIDSIQAIRVNTQLAETPISSNEWVLNLDEFEIWMNEYWPEAKGLGYFLEDGKYISGSEIDKMSKRYFNVVNPDDIVSNYGADTLRLYEMFLGPLELSKPWNTQGIDGVFKFLRRFWNLFHDKSENFVVSTEEPTREEFKVLHKTIKKVAHDIDHFSFNTSISEFMICSNELSSLKCNKRAILEPLCIVLSPFAPHITEELWEKLGHTDSILNATFPQHDEAYLTESSYEYPISINGKVRAKMNFALDMPKEDIEKVVLASEIVKKWSEGKEPKKVIVVPGKIVNIVL